MPYDKDGWTKKAPASEVNPPEKNDQPAPDTTNPTHGSTKPKQPQKQVKKKPTFKDWQAKQNKKQEHLVDKKQVLS